MTMVNGVGAWVIDSERQWITSGGWRKDWHTILADVCRVCSFPRSDIFFGFKYDPEKITHRSVTLKGFAALFLGAAFLIKVN